MLLFLHPQGHPLHVHDDATVSGSTLFSVGSVCPYGRLLDFISGDSKLDLFRCVFMQLQKTPTW